MDKKLEDILESVLFVSGNPVDIDDIISKLHISKEQLNQAVQLLKQRFHGAYGINILAYGNKLQLASNPDYVEEVAAVLNPVREKELTKAMLETLAIIAYKQPITRAEIEELRRVDSSYAVQMLSRVNMICIVGRKEAIGKPLLFATTDEFLRHFSLSSLNDLPEYEQLLERISTMSSIIESKNLYDSNKNGQIFETELPDFMSGEPITIIESND